MLHDISQLDPGPSRGPTARWGVPGRSFAAVVLRRDGPGASAPEGHWPFQHRAPGRRASRVSLRLLYTQRLLQTSHLPPLLGFDTDGGRQQPSRLETGQQIRRSVDDVIPLRQPWGLHGGAGVRCLRASLCAHTTAGPAFRVGGVLCVQRVTQQTGSLTFCLSYPIPGL